MKNHSATHALNHSLLKVLGQETDQRGSLVVPEKLRFDFTAKGAMTVAQVAEAERLTQEVVRKNMQIYAKESSLKIAKKIKGLRSVFDEVYPDPVRVLSFGVPVEDLEANPEGTAGVETSVEFCGGTHLHQSGHIVDFIITVEEAIAKGIRRIVALTGPEAEKARKKTALLEAELVELTKKIDDDKSGANSVAQVKLIVELTEDVSRAVIPYAKKDELRQQLNLMKKTMDSKERNLRAAVSDKVVEEAKNLCQEHPNAKFIVHRFNASNNTKALDSALKQVKTLSGETSALFVSVDEDSKKIFCLAAVPKSAIAKGLKANEWIQQVSSLMGGKGGGKAESAQASGSNYDKADEILELAKKFASSKLE